MEPLDFTGKKEATEISFDLTDKIITNFAVNKKHTIFIHRNVK
jgi:hypothetical protein